MKAEGSYALVFVLTFVLVSALTLVMCKVFDDTTDVVINTSTAAPPFPDAYPQLPYAATAVAQPQQCISYCTDPDTGQLGPCYSTKLQACASDGDCDTCDYALPYQEVTCQAGTAWPTVPAQQEKLENKADKYCLPTRKSCIFVEPDSNGTKQPIQCGSDDDCLRCTDELPTGDRFTCQAVTAGASVALTNANGQTQDFTGVAAGKYCLPTARGCDPKYGSALWTSTEGWKCVCKYPSVYRGDMCNELVACKNNELTPWSKEKQMLLLNMPGVDGSKVGDPWTIDSGVDPNKCVDSGLNQVARLASGACPTGAQATVACQCDGVQEGTHATYRNSATNPLTCELDPCFANPNAGRTADDPASLPTVPYQPKTTCACSGADSRLWEYSAAATSDYYKTGGYKWIGYCKDKTIPNSKVVIKATPSALCDTQANMAANVSGVVPGLRPPPPDMVTKSPTVDGCVADPCAGNYADPLYRTTQSIGHFDAKTGMCACFKGDTPVQPLLANNFPDCDRTVNPVCASCQDACQGGSLDELCPVYLNNINACGNRRCATNPDGTRTCDCGVDCFYYGGVCYPKVESKGSCEGLNKVANVCQDDGERCQLVNSYQWPSCNPGETPVVDKHVICYNHSYCGQASCAGSVLPPQSLFEQLWHHWEPCGGSSQVRFTDKGLNLIAPAEPAAK